MTGRTTDGRRRKSGLWGPALANLAIGVPAMVPLYLGWWLLTEYLPMDCKSVADLGKPDLANCNYTTLDHAVPVMLFLAMTGSFTLALVLAIDVLLPRSRSRRPAAWLRSAALIPVPFAVYLALALALT
ncbi:hypothetical protein [Sphaerisporangium fuscum]|uniref:hypothetical protein n=1 Tax=Sphaerisporangium fuscum TaxID=2835868 RepID=UPI002029A379|nr:hypothetical protein [Sphaerisporangium fuscum]